MIKCNELPYMIFEQNAHNIQEAITTIYNGRCKRVDIGDDIKVYACKNIIRIDIKCKEE